MLLRAGARPAAGDGRASRPVPWWGDGGTARAAARAGGYRQSVSYRSVQTAQGGSALRPAGSRESASRRTSQMPRKLPSRVRALITVTRLGYSRRTARRTACCKQWQALSVINLRRSNWVDRAGDGRHAVTKKWKNRLRSEFGTRF